VAQKANFPFGEETAYADLGRRIRKYTLSAVFREDDHVSDSQALFDACESPGPGMLVHPTRGAVMAACKSCKIKDSLEDKGGETTADMEFVEANEIGGGFGLGGSLFGIIASALFSVSQSSFVRDYQPMLVPLPWRTDVIDRAQALVDVVARTTARVMTPAATETQWRDLVKMQEVAADPALAAIAVNVDRALSTGFNVIDRSVTNADTRFRLMRKLANTAAVTSTLPQGLARDSEEAVLTRFRLLAGIKLAEAAMARIYRTTDEALAALDTAAAVLNDEAQLAYTKCDNLLFKEIRDYATQLTTMMHNLIYRLPGKVLVDFLGGVHPLAAAYTIYRDAKRHRELELHNNVDANGRFKPLVIGVTSEVMRP